MPSQVFKCPRKPNSSKCHRKPSNAVASTGLQQANGRQLEKDRSLEEILFPKSILDAATFEMPGHQESWYNLFTFPLSLFLVLRHSDEQRGIWNFSHFNSQFRYFNCVVNSISLNRRTRCTLSLLTKFTGDLERIWRLQRETETIVSINWPWEPHVLPCPVEIAKVHRTSN